MFNLFSGFFRVFRYFRGGLMFFTAEGGYSISAFSFYPFHPFLSLFILFSDLVRVFRAGGSW